MKLEQTERPITQFQFHKVQLKEGEGYTQLGQWYSFQFHKVQLKAIARIGGDEMTSFQFHKVQLKVSCCV